MVSDGSGCLVQVQYQSLAFQLLGFFAPGVCSNGRRTQDRNVLDSCSIKKWVCHVGVGSTMEVKIKSYDDVINFVIWQYKLSYRKVGKT